MNVIVNKNPIERFKNKNFIKFFQSGGFVTIKKGDSLGKIAKTNGMSLQELLKLNSDIKDPNKIEIGQNIRISGNKKSTRKQNFTQALNRGESNLNNQRIFYQRLNNKPKSNSITILQDYLWKNGAYKGLKDKKGREITYEQAVDGVRGSLTEQAIKNHSGRRQKKISNQPIQKKEDERKGSTIVGEEFNQSLDKLLGGNIKEGGKDLFTTAVKASPLGWIAGKVVQRSFDNAYPYSYGDVIQTKDGLKPYTGDDSKGHVRQTTADDPATLQASSLISKFINGVKGKDPRREYVERMAALDLSTPEGMAEWRNLSRNAPNGTVRIIGDPLNNQFEIRARLDQMNMYAGRPQQWDTYEINPDYESPTAKARGASTYRIKDSKQRERINSEMANYFLSHSKEGYWNDDHTAYILPNMGYMGNQSLVADDENGTNLRYGDWWDYTVNNPYGKRFYTGDRLTEADKTPVRTKYGTGHNTRHMTEQSENLLQNLISENNLDQNFLSNLIN